MKLTIIFHTERARVLQRLADERGCDPQTLLWELVECWLADCRKKTPVQLDVWRHYPERGVPP